MFIPIELRISDDYIGNDQIYNSLVTAFRKIVYHKELFYKIFVTLSN